MKPEHNPESSLYSPPPAPIPPDLFTLEIACNSGSAYHGSGFRLTDNGFMQNGKPRIGEKLEAWAWELGWREQEFLKQIEAEQQSSIVNARARSMRRRS